MILARSALTSEELKGIAYHLAQADEGMIVQPVWSGRETPTLQAKLLPCRRCQPHRLRVLVQEGESSRWVAERRGRRLLLRHHMCPHWKHSPRPALGERPASKRGTSSPKAAHCRAEQYLQSVGGFGWARAVRGHFTVASWPRAGLPHQSCLRLCLRIFRSQRPLNIGPEHARTGSRGLQTSHDKPLRSQ